MTTQNSKPSTQNSAPGIRECRQCDYAAVVLHSRADEWVCANHPEHAGRLVAVSGGAVPADVAAECRAFRRRVEFTPPATGEDVRYIPLSSGLFAIVDAADYEWLKPYRWRASGGDSSYACCQMNGRKVYMHKLIANPPAGKVVDHANGNRWDNRRGNLRICSQGENLANRRKAGGTSRFKGVYWDKVRRKWRVMIRCQGKTYHMGRFADEIQAAMAYDRIAWRLFGPFARLNFPEPKHVVNVKGTVHARCRTRGKATVVKAGEQRSVCSA
jgi:hypothetical protein